jgi:hypothetical protein
VHMPESTKTHSGLKAVAYPPTVWRAMLAALRSGWQRSRRLGRGLPNRFFCESLVLTSRLRDRRKDFSVVLSARVSFHDVLIPKITDERLLRI